MKSERICIDSLLWSNLCRLAEQGVPEAQYRVGMLYQNGDGVVRNPALSFEMLLKAANQDHPKAQLAVAICLSKGIGVAIDFPQAAKYFELAGRQGVREAVWRLGDMLLEGRGIPKDAVRARKLYEQACTSEIGRENICSEAEWSLGVMLEEGLGGDVDLDAAKEHYSRASENDWHNSLRGNKNAFLERDLAALELRYARMKDSGLGDFDAYRRAAEVGSYEAMKEYVVRSADANITYTRGEIDGPFDRKVFRKSMDTLVKRRNPEGVLLACQMTLERRGCEPRYTVAGNNCFKILFPLVLSRNLEACQMLARVYATGTGVERSTLNELRCYRIAKKCDRTLSHPLMRSLDFKKRVSALIDACEHKDGGGEYGIWKLLSEGDEVAASPKTAFPWFEKALAKGNADALNDQRAKEAKKRAEACRRASEWFRNGGNVFRCAELGVLEAQSLAARILAEGRHRHGEKPIKKDLAAAIAWYRKILESTTLSAEDMWRYANCLSEEGTTSQVEITRLYAEAAEAGFDNARFSYAQRLIEGAGCVKDRLLAKEMLQRTKGHVGAQDLLAKLYVQDEDVVNALKCYKKILVCRNRIMAEDEQLKLEKGKFIGRSRDWLKEWATCYERELKSVSAEVNILLRAARMALISCYSGVASVEVMKECWHCLNHTYVCFPSYSESNQDVNASNDEEALEKRLVRKMKFFNPDAMNGNLSRLLLEQFAEQDQLEGCRHVLYKIYVQLDGTSPTQYDQCLADLCSSIDANIRAAVLPIEGLPFLLKARMLLQGSQKHDVIGEQFKRLLDIELDDYMFVYDNIVAQYLGLYDSISFDEKGRLVVSTGCSIDELKSL